MYDENFMESFSLDPMKGIERPTSNEIFTEAVFADGKNQVQPLVDQMQKIKDLLDQQTNEQEETAKQVTDAQKMRKSGEIIKSPPKVKAFDPVAFWKNELFKELEDQIGSIFGFRNVEVHPYREKYNSSTKMFESKVMNCEIYHSDRYPVEGLVSDKGFFDKSKSLVMQIYISLGLLKTLTAEEVVAVLLHEFGHSIDPALVDIKYTETNILSKYLTDRKNCINKNEKKAMKKYKLAEIGIVLITYISLFAIIFLPTLFQSIYEKIIGKEKVEAKKLEQVKKMVQADDTRFDRQSYSEAYADNFARMYGFGSQLMSALKKLSASMNREMKSRYKKEKARREYIMFITEMLIKDVHKTDVHRIRGLINEYKIDIDDPNISDVTKTQLKEDLAELEKILNEYLNNFDSFQNRVNKTINDELKKIEIKDSHEAKKQDKAEEKKEDKKEETPKSKEEAIKEGFTFFEENTVFEEKHPLQERMEDKCPLDKGDLAKIREKFGHSKACSFAKDKDGYFAYTHRCRSKSHKTIEGFPKKDVDFVRSTS